MTRGLIAPYLILRQCIRLVVSVSFVPVLFTALHAVPGNGRVSFNISWKNTNIGFVYIQNIQPQKSEHQLTKPDGSNPQMLNSADLTVLKSEASENQDCHCESWKLGICSNAEEETLCLKNNRCVIIELEL